MLGQKLNSEQKDEPLNGTDTLKHKTHPAYLRQLGLNTESHESK